MPAIEPLEFIGVSCLRKLRWIRLALNGFSELNSLSFDLSSRQVLVPVRQGCWI